jgi:hypothetical protein
MLESLIGLGLVSLLGLVAWAANADAEALIRSGMALASAGFAFGIPTAIVYHWRLRASLVRAQRLPRGWWISPTRHHGLVPIAERRGVLVWGALGGSGFVVIVLGLVLTSIGLWRLLTP